MYELLPFWHALVYALWALTWSLPRSPAASCISAGQATIPSDTVCYPGQADARPCRSSHRCRASRRIFYPCMSYNLDEHLGDNHYNCPVVAYYPEVHRGEHAQPCDRVDFIHDYVGIDPPQGAFRRSCTGMSAAVLPGYHRPTRCAARARRGYAGLRRLHERTCAQRARR